MEAVSAGLALVAAGIDTLLDADTAALDAAGFAGLVRALEVQRRRWEAVDQQLLAAAAQRGPEGEFGATSLRDWLVALLRLSPGEARARVARAQQLGPRRSLTGEPLPPSVPVAAAAVRAGEISAAHVGVLLDTMREIPDELPVGVRESVEQNLVGAAREMEPGRVRAVGQRILAHLDPDGSRPREEQQQRLRGLVERPGRDGTWHWELRLTPQCRAAWRAVLDALSRPGGPEDLRTPAQRQHDALHEVARRLLRSGSLPDAGGAPATILIWARAADVAARRGTGETEYGQPVPMGELTSAAAEAEIVPVLLDDAGGVKSYGRARRFATRAQRRALAARDRGCCFVGCSRPASWCDVHHATPWSSGGRTDIDDMCLLCTFHHHLLDRDDGWELVMIDAVPHWRAPAYLDPARTPRRNTANHLPEIDFRASP